MTGILKNELTAREGTKMEVVEKLRESLKAHNPYVLRNADLAEAANEIERLTRGLDNEMVEHERTVMQRDRLRVALNEIAGHSKDCRASPLTCLAWMQGIAERAIADEQIATGSKNDPF